MRGRLRGYWRLHMVRVRLSARCLCHAVVPSGTPTNARRTHYQAAGGHIAPYPWRSYTGCQARTRWHSRHSTLVDRNGMRRVQQHQLIDLDVAHRWADAALASCLHRVNRRDLARQLALTVIVGALLAVTLQ